MKYPIVIERTRNGYAGQVLDVENLFAAADTQDEVRSLLRDILIERLEELRAEGRALPVPTTVVDTVEIA